MMTSRGSGAIRRCCGGVLPGVHRSGRDGLVPLPPPLPPPPPPLLLLLLLLLLFLW